MKIVDLHNDFLTELNNFEIDDYLIKNEGFLKILCCPVWTTNLKNALNYIKNCKKTLKKYDFCKLCIEDIGFLNNFDDLIDINPYYVGLVWNSSNKFCGGAYDKGGITQKGRDLICFLEEKHIIVDIAHMNKCSFNNFCSLTSRPMFCSHTGFDFAVCDKRNLDDKQIKQIISTNGLIGLYFVGKYNSKNKVSVFDIAKNIELFVEKYGYKNLAIGSDFFGTTDLPDTLKTYSDFTYLYEILIKHGFSYDMLKHIFYNNFLNRQLSIDKL